MPKKTIAKKEKEVDKDKKVLSIALPNELYQLLLEKSGKGNIGNYVREAVEAKLKEEEMLLTKAYRNLEENEEYQKELGLFQRAWEDYEEGNLDPSKVKRKKNG